MNDLRRQSSGQSKLVGGKKFTSSPSSYRIHPNFCPSVTLSLVFFFAQLDMIPLPLGVLLSNHENCTVHQSSLCHDGLVCQGNADVCATYLQITVKENR